MQIEFKNNKYNNKTTATTISRWEEQSKFSNCACLCICLFIGTCLHVFEWVQVSNKIYCFPLKSIYLHCSLLKSLFIVFFFFFHIYFTFKIYVIEDKRTFWFEIKKAGIFRHLLIKFDSSVFFLHTFFIFELGFISGIDKLVELLLFTHNVFGCM